MILKKLLWIIPFLLYSHSSVVSQPVRFGSPQITNFTPDNYNAAEQNWYIFQDRRGLIYVANADGVLEFSGNHWKLIPLTNKLGAWRIVDDSDGKIYVAGSGDFGYLASDRNCNTVYKSILYKIPEEYRNFRDIWGFYYFENKIIVIAYDKIFIIGADKTKVIKREPRIGELGCFDDKLFVQIPDKGIYYLKNNELHEVIKTKKLYRRLIKWDDQKAVLAGHENGLFLIENNEIVKWETEIDQYFPDFSVYHILPIGEQFFAIATVKNGIIIVDKNGKIRRHIDKKSGLLANTVYYLFLDNQKRLWAGQSKGISCIEIFSPFTHLNELNNINGSISTSAAYDNKLFFGGEPYLYNIEWPIKNEWQIPQVAQIEINTGQIYKLTVINDELFCNHQKGLSIINKNRGIQTIRLQGTCWGLAFLGNKEENLLISTDKEAFVIEKRKEQWVIKNKLKGHSSFEKVLGFDYNNCLWTYARNEGIAKLQLNKDFDSVIDTKIFTHVGKAMLNSKTGLFVIDKQVFVQHEGEVYAFNSFLNDFVKVNFEFDGKISDIISWQELENLWAKTSEGIVRFTKGADATYYPVFGEYVNFRFLDKTSQVNMINDSLFIFMHSNGISYYLPVENKDTLATINARLQQVSLINSDSIVFGGAFPSNSDIFSDTQTKEDVPVLNYQNNSLRFSFATAAPQVNKKIIYQFRLDNFDKVWSKWSAETSKDYTNLSDGTYNFQVRAKTSNGKEGPITSYKFKILPPWYNTTKAYVTYVILIIAIILFLFRLNVRRIRKRYNKDTSDFKIDLITNISHEIKTPISLILSPLEEILAKGDDTKERESLHMLMYRNAKRLKQLVNLLLDFRRDEEGNMKLKIKKGDIVQFVEDLFISFEYVAKINKVDYQFNTDFESKSFYFDNQKLEIILTNLLSNAFKYIGKGGRINLAISDNTLKTDCFILKDFVDNKPELQIGHLNTNKFIEISIEDSGSGISKKNMAKIFEKFYHNKSRNNLRIKNTGLGLAFSKKLIQLHRGEIRVWSKPDYGSRFSVRLAQNMDYYDKNELEEDYSFYSNGNNIGNKDTKISTEDNNKNKPCMLLVDDEADMRVYLRKLFENDYRVIEASNGNEALKILKHKLPDIIISDIKMPEMSGVELCREVKENVFTSHIPVLLLTGDDTEKSQFDSFESGANQYIAKPFNPNLLKVRVKTLIENSNKLRKELHFNFNNGQLNTKKDNLLERAAGIINDNLTNPDFNINSLAFELNLSRTVFYKKFNECIEISPNEFIQIMRLEKSKSLLENEALTISEVADLVGFNDPKYFSTSFKKHFNQSPRKYRQNINGSANI